MYDTIDKQTVMIECLTLYMNYFKTYFSLVYQQIDCYVNHAKSIINSNNNIVNLSSPSLISTNNNNNSNRISYPKFTYSPFNLPVTQPYSKSYIDRFHMRIIQYLEYRLVNVINKSLNKNQDQIFILVRGFINSLNKVFLFKVNNQYQNNRQQKQFKLNHKGLHIPSIGSLFLEIEHCIKSFFQGIFRYLQNICLKDLQILQQLKSLKNKIFTQIFSPFHQYLIGFQNQSTQTSQYNDTQNQKFYQSNNIILNNKNQQKKSSYKIQQSYRSLLNSKRSQSLGKNMTELKNNINAQKNNSQQYEFFSSSYEQKQIIEQKKDSYADLLSIMQIQTIDIYSREYIMRELKAKNMKNKLSIGKFVKLYKKKQKRHQQNKKISLQNNIHKQQQCYSLTGSVQCVGDGNDTNQLQSTDDNNESKNNLYSLKQKIVVISSSNTNKDQQKKADSLLQRQKIIVSINEIGKNNSKDNIDSNNNNNSDHFIQQKLTPNRIHYSSNNQNPKKHDTLRHIPCVIKNNPITKNNPQLLQLTKDAFLYKQKEKLYFEQLKSKFNNIKNNSNNNSNTNRFQKVSSSSISSISSLPKQMIKRDCIQLEMLKRVNVSNINSQRRLISQYLQETKQQKQSQRNLTKRPTIKGPNFSSFIVVLNNNNNNENNSNKNNNNNNNKNNNNNNNKNNNNKNKTNNKQINYNYYSERQCHSNSQLLSKNHLLLQNINNSQQTLYMLQGSSVQKLLHANKKRKQVSLLQQKQQKHHYQQQSSSSIVKNYNNLKTSYKRQQQTVIKSNNNNAIKMKKNNNGEIQDAAVVMLPRIVVAKLKTITRKNNNII